MKFKDIILGIVGIIIAVLVLDYMHIINLGFFSGLKKEEEKETMKEKGNIPEKEVKKVVSTIDQIKGLKQKPNKNQSIYVYHAENKLLKRLQEHKPAVEKAKEQAKKKVNISSKAIMVKRPTTKYKKPISKQYEIKFIKEKSKVVNWADKGYYEVGEKGKLLSPVTPTMAWQRIYMGAYKSEIPLSIALWYKKNYSDLFHG